MGTNTSLEFRSKVPIQKTSPRGVGSLETGREETNARTVASVSTSEVNHADLAL